MTVATRKSKEKAQFGDFQTPEGLAIAAVKLLSRLGIKPGTVIEPTCGTGTFLAAGATVFQDAEEFVGLDINASHLEAARIKIASVPGSSRVSLSEADFFETDWRQTLSACPTPFLILGNPPWVTSSELGSLASVNLPVKSNIQGHAGIDAITGKSNFDISEWILQRYLT